MTKRRIFRAYMREQTPGLNTEITATGGGAVVLLRLQAKTAKPLFV